MKNVKKTDYIKFIYIFLIIFHFVIYSYAGENAENSSIFGEDVGVPNSQGVSPAEPEKKYRFMNIFSGEILLINGYDSMNKWQSKDTAGFEFYGVLSGAYGDILTLNIQMRFGFNSEFTKKDNPFRYGDFKSWDDYNKVIETHNVFVRFKFLRGYLNLTLGNSPLAYGLQSVTDTHATLINKLTFYDLGIERDWGITFSGQTEAFDYSVSFTLGSGMGIHWEQKHKAHYLSNLKISFPLSDAIIGFSFLYGKILPVMHTLLLSPISQDTIRIVIDSRINLYQFRLDIEVMMGWQKRFFTNTHGMYAQYSMSEMDMMNVKFSPDTGALVHLVYIPNWADNRLTFTLGPRFIARSLTTLEKVITLTIEFNISYKLGKLLEIQLGYHQDVYNRTEPRNWNINLLFLLNLNRS